MECRQQTRSIAKLLCPAAQLQLETTFYVHQAVMQNNDAQAIVCIKEEMDLELLGIHPATWPAMTFNYDDFVPKCIQLTSCCQSCKSLKHKNNTASPCCLATGLCSDAMLLVTGEIRVTEQPCLYAALNAILHARYRELCTVNLSHAAHMHTALGRDNILNLVCKLLEWELSKNCAHCKFTCHASSNNDDCAFWQLIMVASLLCRHTRRNSKVDVTSLS